MWVYNEALFDRLFAMVASYIMVWLLVIPGQAMPEEEGEQSDERNFLRLKSSLRRSAGEGRSG